MTRGRTLKRYLRQAAGLLTDMAEISGGENILPEMSMRASSFGARSTLYGTIFISSLTSANRRPMKRLMENTVFSGLVMAWRFAT